MGIFTWTDATVKSPKKNKWGSYKRKEVVEYGGYAKLICPDDTAIETECHSSYGMIGMYDIYDLVVDWNKDDLPKLFEEMEPKHFGKSLEWIAKELAHGTSDEEITEKVRGLVAEGKMSEYLISEWKRNIGIAIACDDTDTKKLSYPIKLTKEREAHGYDELYISYSTQ